MKRAGLMASLLVGLAAGTVWWWRSSSSPSPVKSGTEADPPLASEPVAAPVRPRVEYAPLRPRAVSTGGSAPVRPTNTIAFPASTTAVNAVVGASNAVAIAPAIQQRFLAPVHSPNAARNLCLSNLQQIVWAANVWSGLHGEMLLPRDLMWLTNELGTPLPLVCPEDPSWSQKATTNWAEFRPEWITYQLSQDTLNRNRNARVGLSFNYVFCPVHQRWCLGDRPSPPRGWVEWWMSMNPGKSPYGFNVSTNPGVPP